MIISVLKQRAVSCLKFHPVQSAVVLNPCLGTAGLTLSELSHSSVVPSALQGLFEEQGLCGCPAWQRLAGITKHTRKPQQANPGGLQLLHRLPAFSVLLPFCAPSPERDGSVLAGTCASTACRADQKPTSPSQLSLLIMACATGANHIVIRGIYSSLLLIFHKACFTRLPNSRHLAKALLPH